MIRKTILGQVLLLLSLTASAQSADTVRFMHYNLLKYGFEWACMPQSTKNNYLKTIFGAYKPDILTVNEIEPKASTIEGLRTNTLQYNAAMRSTPFSNSNGSDIVNCLYYNESKFGYLSSRAIKGNVRDIDVHRLYHKASTTKGDTAEIWYIVAHLKAGTDYAADRGEAAVDIKNWLTANRKVTRYFIAGDFNLYGVDEPAWVALTGGSNPAFIDPADMAKSGWHGQAFAGIHTQSPNDKTNDCAATGGMDDRFDFILTSPVIAAGTQDIDILGYRAYGNDGQSYNEALDCTNTKSVSNSVCLALRRVSDHLPVVMELSFPVKNTGANNDLPFKANLRGNPARTQLVVGLETSESGTYRWEITNVLGQRLAEGSESVTLPGALFYLPLPEMAAGSYFLTIRNRDDQALMLKFVKI